MNFAYYEFVTSDMWSGQVVICFKVGRVLHSTLYTLVVTSGSLNYCFSSMVSNQSVHSALTPDITHLLLTRPFLFRNHSPGYAVVKVLLRIKNDNYATIKDTSIMPFLHHSDYLIGIANWTVSDFPLISKQTFHQIKNGH